jgi:hypothetical protein
MLARFKQVADKRDGLILEEQGKVALGEGETEEPAPAGE